jgi:thioredoxin-like negative regulator of GroEL
MTALTANLVFQTLIMATGAQPYAEAYKTTEETGKPLLVLVGADWCPGCVTMKKSTLARMEKLGKLKQVSYSVINTDHDPTTANQVMRGSSIPQLVLFEKTPSGWKRSQITGAVSEGDVEAFIGRAVEQQARLARQRAATKRAEVSGGGQ